MELEYLPGYLICDDSEQSSNAVKQALDVCKASTAEVGFLIYQSTGRWDGSGACGPQGTLRNDLSNPLQST